MFRMGGVIPLGWVPVFATRWRKVSAALSSLCTTSAWPMSPLLKYVRRFMVR